LTEIGLEKSVPADPDHKEDGVSSEEEKA